MNYSVLVNEFEMARAEGIFPIPIGATGNQAKELWDRMRADLGQYYGDATADVEPHFAALNDPKRSAEELADAAVRIVMALRPRTLP